MRDRPSGPELLWQARRVVLDELLQHLPDDKRYDALMVAAAMATAAREGEAGDGPLRRAHDELARLFGERAHAPAERDALQEALDGLMRRLAAGIRGGDFDADPDVHEALYRTTVDRLGESNPKHLKARGA